MIKNFYIFRHGETDYNKAQRMQGHMDIPLNDLGKEQARSLLQKFDGIQLDVIYSSDLKRASETGSFLSGHFNLPLILCSNLRECCLGKAEGLYKDEVIEKFGQEALETFYSFTEENMRANPFQGETKAELLERMKTALEHFARDSEFSHIGVATHGGAMRTLFHSIMEDPFVQMKIDNCSLYHLAYDHQKEEWQFFGELT